MLRLLDVVGMLSIDVVTVVLSALNGKNNATSYTAHLAGAVMGVVVGLVILKNRKVEFWQIWLRIACCGFAALYLFVMIILQFILPFKVQN